MNAALAPVESAPAIDLADVRRRLKANRNALAGYFSAERADIFLGLDACALARHHLYIGGPPGLAKSLIVETWAHQFTAGALYRRELLTRQTAETDVLCYLDVPAFAKQGVYVYRYDGKITEGHFAFVDEAFKASGSLLNALLTWLNERTVRGGYRSPLVTAIAASNEFGEDDTTAALEDRFLVRFWIDRLGAAARLAFLRGRAAGSCPPSLEYATRAELEAAQREAGTAGSVPPSLAPVTLAELEAAQREVATFPVDDAVTVALSALSDALYGIGIEVSDRRIGWCVEILRAIAWLDGADCVDVDHIDFLSNVLWRRPEDKPGVDAAIATVDRGVIGEVRRLCETALAPYHEARANLDAAAFRAVAHGHATRIHDAAGDIRDRFGGRVPERLRPRVRGYLAELREAYEACQEAARTL